MSPSCVFPAYFVQRCPTKSIKICSQCDKNGKRKVECFWMRYQKARVSISLRHHTMFAFLWGVGGGMKKVLPLFDAGVSEKVVKKEKVYQIYTWRQMLFYNEHGIHTVFCWDHSIDWNDSLSFHRRPFFFFSSRPSSLFSQGFFLSQRNWT